MDTASVTTAQTTQSTQSTAAPAAAGGAGGDNTASTGAAISSDFETFLKMLTVQMKNQDPMKPMDSSDFAVQLATFSGVEQQVKTNDLLKTMGTQLGSMNMSNLAGWVGMEARAATAARYSGTPLTLQPNPASGAEKTYVVVKDSAGNVVNRVETPVSDEPIQWAGVDAAGKPLPNGLYTFNLQSFSQDKIITDEQMSVYSQVVEARVENGQTVLVLDGGAEVPASEIDALRQPNSP